MTDRPPQPAPYAVTWEYRGEGSFGPRTDRINLSHGRSKGYDDISTAQRILAIACLGSLDLAPDVVILGATPADILPKYDRIMTTDRIMTAGADLLSEEGENAEYDRAIVELVSDLIGVCHEERGQTLATLRGLKGRS